MNKIQTENVTLQVSAIGGGGWWSGNFEEYVSAGTALGEDFTEVIYTPSSETKIAKFDADSQSWIEREDNRLIRFYSEYGEYQSVANPDDELPDWAVMVAPPEVDENSFAEWVSGEWVVKPLDSFVTKEDRAQEYLDKTDFYVLRKLETGAAIPAEVMHMRDKCRAVLVTILPDMDFLADMESESE